MINFEKNSFILRDFLVSTFGKQVPGCIFYITKNGIPFADGSFGWARMPGSPDGVSTMTPNTIIHTGSVGKIFGALSLIRMVEEWNSIHAALDADPMLAPSDPNELPFWNFVRDYGTPIDLDSQMWPLIEPYLDHSLISGYISAGSTYPGANIRDITLRQLMYHDSGISSYVALADTGATEWRQIHYEPSNGGPVVFDLKAYVTALLKLDAGENWHQYQSNNYTLIGAIIESVTGRRFEDYAIGKLFRGDHNYDDIKRKVIDPVRGARYYKFVGDNYFQGRVLHPDYTGFSAAGGWYMSAIQFCKWFDNIMNGGQIGNGLFPAVFDLEHESFKDSGFKAFDHGKIGRLQYLNHNGAAGPGGGEVNADFRYCWGYDNERYCVFTAVNANFNASMLIEQGVSVLKKSMTKRHAGLRISSLNLQNGLIQTVYSESSTITHGSASMIKVVTLENKTIEGVASERTNLFGTGNVLPGGINSNYFCMVELRGMLKIPTQGYYKFRLSSDDGSLLWIDDDLLIDFNSSHGLESRESARVYLFAAETYYPIRVEWFNDEGDGQLYLEWVLPNSTAYEAIPPENFLVG